MWGMSAVLKPCAVRCLMSSMTMRTLMLSAASAWLSRRETSSVRTSSGRQAWLLGISVCVAAKSEGCSAAQQEDRKAYLDVQGGISLAEQAGDEQREDKLRPPGLVVG